VYFVLEDEFGLNGNNGKTIPRQRGAEAPTMGVNDNDMARPFYRIQQSYRVLREKRKKELINFINQILRERTNKIKSE
jgi:hypothetical protein